MSDNVAVNVFLHKKSPRKEMLVTQDELCQQTIDNLHKFITDKFTFKVVQPDFIQTPIDALNYEIQKTTAPLIIVADAGVLFMKNPEDVFSRFTWEDKNKQDSVIQKPKEDRLGVIGFKLMSRDYELVDAGIEFPLKSQPMFRRFGEPPIAAEIMYEDTNTYLDSKLIVIRRDAYNDVGGFEDNAGLFYMINFCHEASVKKWKILYLPEEVLYTNYYEIDAGVLDDMYKDAQTWFDLKVNPRPKELKEVKK